MLVAIYLLLCWEEYLATSSMSHTRSFLTLSRMLPRCSVCTTHLTCLDLGNCYILTVHNNELKVIHLYLLLLQNHTVRLHELLFPRFMGYLVSGF